MTVPHGTRNPNAPPFVPTKEQLPNGYFAMQPEGLNIICNVAHPMYIRSTPDHDVLEISMFGYRRVAYSKDPNFTWFSLRMESEAGLMQWNSCPQAMRVDVTVNISSLKYDAFDPVEYHHALVIYLRKRKL